MSDSFTIEDIHRIRIENYEATKSLTPKERIERRKAETAAFWKRFTEMGGVVYGSVAELLAARNSQSQQL